MMSVTSWLVAMATMVAAIGLGNGISMDRMAKDIEKTEHIQIVHVTPDHIRQRRSSSHGHPEELHFDLHHGEGHVTKMRLKRMAEHSALKGGIRVYRIRDNRLRQVPDSETDPETAEGNKNDNAKSKDRLSSDAGFYTDAERTSLFRIRSSRHRLKAYDLEGTVIMNNREYIVTPNNEYLEANASARAHRLCRLMKHLNYGLDTMHDETQDTRDRSQSRRAPLPRRFPWYAKPYRSGRTRRQVERNTNFVEVVFYCDFACYNDFQTNAEGLRAANESVMGTIRDHFTFIAKAMNLRYESISENVPDQQILISAQNLVVLDRADLSEFTERNQVSGLMEAQDAIIAFRSYIRGGNGVPRADHWMLFTGYDLAVQGNQNTIGIAYLNRICSDASVSLIEEFYSGTTAQIAAHELGHIMGAEHDSSYGQCDDFNYNIMAGTSFFPLEGEKVQNPWKFSACSAQVITDFISGPSGTCLKNRPSRITTSTEEAGQTFNADAQCRLSQGPNSFFCRGVQRDRGLDLMCVRMYCYLPDEAPNCIGLVALDGTSCGDGKWCQKGTCQRGEEAPRIPQGNICPQGDDPSYGCTARSCNTTDAKNTFCCKTCGSNVGPANPAPSRRPPNPPPSRRPPNPRPSRRPRNPRPTRRPIPPINIRTRAPAIQSINHIIKPPAPPPPHGSPGRPKVARGPTPTRRPRRPQTAAAPTPRNTSTTTTTTRAPPRRPPVLPPWYRTPAPPPPPPPPQRTPQQTPRRQGRNNNRQCYTELCRCVNRNNTWATCFFRAWFQGK